MSLYYNKELVDGVEELPRLTQAEFDNLPLEQKPKMWIKRNATETDRGITGSDVEYDNSVSGLTATNVQDAIDEVEGDLTSLDASNLPYSSTQSTKQKIDESERIDNITITRNGTYVSGIYLYSVKKVGKILSVAVVFGLNSGVPDDAVLFTLSNVTIKSMAYGTMYTNGMGIMGLAYSKENSNEICCLFQQASGTARFSLTCIVE